MATEKELRKRICDQANAWLGRNEADGSHKEIIDIYNSHSPLARGYKVKYTDAWCATFVSAVFIKTGLVDLAPTECGCYEMVNRYKSNDYPGSWKEDDAYVPNPGDVIMYDWQDSGSGDNTGVPDHTGIVTEVTGDLIVVIEGNYDNAVKVRTIEVNSRYIRGYGLPAFAEHAEAEPEPIVIITDPCADKCYIAGNGGFEFFTDQDKAIEYANENKCKVYECCTGNFVYEYKEPVDLYTPVTALYMRSNPGFVHPVVATIPAGAEVTYLKETKNYFGTPWLKIRYNDKEGWSSSKYLKKK